MLTRLIIAQLLLGAVAVASQPSARSQLTREQIQAAIREAPKDWLGDSGSTQREYFYGSFVRDLCDKYLRIFESFPAAQQFMSSALPQSQPRETRAQ